MANKVFTNFPQITVGTIFASSWGYEQTNVNFYQVVKRTEKMVEIAEIQSELVTIEKDGAMTGKVKAKKDAFCDEGKTYRKKLWSHRQDQSQAGVSINDYENAYETTEEKTYCVSWYY